MSLFVRPLFDGPVDIVGDIHGEIEALDALLLRLGYDRDGNHPRGRRLVFVGDLVDRGADSPAVVERVASMVVADRAQCVLGNHELNLLLRKSKEGNGWFQPPESDHDHARGHFRDVVRATPSQRKYFMDWFATLPVALVRDDLRVVHACWHDDHVNALASETRPVVDAYAAHEAGIRASLAQSGTFLQRDRELDDWGHLLCDREATVPLLAGVAAIDSLRQSDHPFKALTSGLERPTSEPFFASGKWRMTERVMWWADYLGAPSVVMGHYWRWPGAEADATARSRGPNLFEGHDSFDWIGPRRNVMCIDWCVGLRWRERQAGAATFEGKLGALRWDTRTIILDH